MSFETTFPIQVEIQGFDNGQKKSAIPHQKNLGSSSFKSWVKKGFRLIKYSLPSPSLAILLEFMNF